MHTFEFMTAARIIFGCGSIQQAGGMARKLGGKALLVHGKNRGRAETLLEIFAKNQIEVIEYTVDGEPDIEAVEKGVRLARENTCDLVVGIGGGSVLDAAKAIAAMVPNLGAILDYLEVIGSGRKLRQTPVPWIAIPTTAGTGSEVTKNAVIADKQRGVKVSMRDDHMLAYAAVIDPELTISVPSDVTACSGLDALTQLIEAFTSCQSNPLTDAVCKEGIRRAAENLQLAYEDGSNLAARSELCLASLFGGLALANAKLGAVHAFAGPIGGRYGIGHGAICAALLGGVMRMNVRTLKKRGRNDALVAKYDVIGELLTGRPNAKSFHAVEWVEALCETLHIKKLSAYGVKATEADAIVAQAKQAGSMKGNPIELTEVELKEILLGAL